jgi:hypothetical protein
MLRFRAGWMLARRWLLAVFVLLALLCIAIPPVPAGPVEAAPLEQVEREPPLEPDFDIITGRFYTQAAMQPEGRGPYAVGFSVTNEGGIPMWDEYRRLGGPGVLGYPISRRFFLDGTVMQAFQKAVLMWDAGARRAVAAPILDMLHSIDADAWLEASKGLPAFVPVPDEGGKPWEELARLRYNVYLDPFPPFQQRYFALFDPVNLLGLPAAPPKDMGSAVVLRFQRGALQQWKQEMPWARAGEITIASVGEIARESGLLPKEAFEPEESPLLTGEAARKPWSGWWWPSNPAVPGPKLYDPNGPLDRYDRFVTYTGAPNPRTREWELANNRFTGAKLNWAGHCNGWAAAAVLEPEPVQPRTIAGIVFGVAEQKGLLSAYHFADGAQWIYGSDSEKVNPADFHRQLLRWIGQERKAFVVSFRDQGDEIWSYPAYKFRLVMGPDPLVPGRWHVRATVWFAAGDVAPGFVGTKPWPGPEGKLFEYFVTGDPRNPIDGAWEGNSVSGFYGHPRYIWYPDPSFRNEPRVLTSPGLTMHFLKFILGRENEDV